MKELLFKWALQLIPPFVIKFLNFKEIASLCGTWEVAVGAFHGNWIFLKDGTVLSTDGSKKGNWKKTIFIRWTDYPDRWETLDLPLHNMRSTGDSWQKQDIKVDAKKIS
jgi:hypothetical protein